MHPARPSLRLDIVHRARIAALLGAALWAALLGTSAGAQSPASAPLDIVVTTAVLGSVVTDLVGDGANVTVLMGNGTDPHDWSPSAQDIERVHAADLVVENGLGLETVLGGALDEVAAAGVPVFVATDHITVRAIGPEDPTDQPVSSGAPGTDPHFWVDPVSMRAVVDALVPVIGALGVDVADRGADLDARLDALDAEVRTLLAPIPEASRKLVTGHDSMGYFADRYGFTLVGAVIPGLSSQGEVSARELADIAGRIQAEGVTVIFTEIGTPQSVVDAIAGATGVSVVQLPSHTMPADGSYFTFIRSLATAIADALA